MNSSRTCIAIFMAIFSVSTFALENDPVDVLTATADIDYFVQARVNDTRMFVWTTDNTRGQPIRGAFADAGTNTLVGEPFELVSPGESFTCEERTCQVMDAPVALIGALPSLHGSDVSGQFLVVWAAIIHPDVSDGSLRSNRNVLGRFIRILPDGTPEVQPIFRISYIDDDTQSGHEAREFSINGIAYNPADDEYLVTWMGNHQGEEYSQPYLQFIESDGTRIGTGNRLYSQVTGHSSVTMSATFNVDAREYLITLNPFGSEAGTRSLIGTAVDVEGDVTMAMRTIEPEPLRHGYAGQAALLPLSSDRTLVFFNDLGSRASAFWYNLDEEGPGAAGRVEIADTGVHESLLHAEIVAMTGMDAAVLAYTDNASDGDGVNTTGELRYRTFDLSTATDAALSIGPVRVASTLSGDAVKYYGNNQYRRTASDALDATRFITFFVDSSKPRTIQALEHDVVANELAIIPAGNITVTAGKPVELSFSVENRGNIEEIAAYRAFPENNAALRVIAPIDFEVLSATGCVFDPETQLCMIDEVAAGSDHDVTFTVSTAARSAITVEESQSIEVSIVSETNGMDPSNNTATATFTIKPKPADPNDPNNPGTSSSGGGSAGWLMLAVLAVGARRRTRLQARSL